MRYGIIDIGSNTMRVVVYEVEGQSFSEVINEKEYAELISYVEDNVLSEEGIEKLCATLAQMQNLCRILACEKVFCFATASLRNVDNSPAVMLRVRKECGLLIDILTGCEEAFYDYIGLKNLVQLDEALGFDLGGGSGQIFYYKNNTLMRSASYGIGCLKLYNSCVAGVFPNSSERAAIEKMVKSNLKKDNGLAKTKQEYIFGMGGTARACAKVHRKMIGSDQGTNYYTLTLNDLKELDEVVTGLGLNGIKILNRLIPERLCTIIPGIIAVRTIMQFVGVKKLRIVKYGVREGYLLEHVINQGSELSRVQGNQLICQ